MSSTQHTPRIIVVLLALIGFASGACSPAAPRGPRPTGVTSRAFVGDTEIVLKYRYEPQVGKELTFYVDAEASRGGSGALRLTLQLEGFTVVRGKPTWDVTVAPGRTETHEVVLRATDPVARVSIVTRHVERDVELAKDAVRFWVTEDNTLAECDAEAKACQ